MKMWKKKVLVTKFQKSLILWMLNSVWLFLYLFLRRLGFKRINLLHPFGDLQVILLFLKLSKNVYLISWWIPMRHSKVQIFWECHKILAHLPLFFYNMYLVASNYKWKMGQIFLVFSENLNFTMASDAKSTELKSQTWASSPDQPEKCQIWSILLRKKKLGAPRCQNRELFLMPTYLQSFSIPNGFAY